MKKWSYLALVTGFMFLTAFKCQTNNPKPCQGNIACTMDFRSFSVKVIDSEKVPVKLDSYVVIDKKTGEDITPSQDPMMADNSKGEYVLIDDSKALKYKAKKTIATFKGYKDGQLVAVKDFEVGADCCHVFVSTANKTIIADFGGVCNTLIACTEVFITAHVYVYDGEGKPYILDDYFVYDDETGADITSIHKASYDYFPNGFYILVDDSHLSLLKAKTKSVTFKGIKSGKEVCRQSFEVGADCCHVFSVDEKPTIVVE